MMYRANVLAAFRASASETEELLAYNHNAFDHTCLKLPLHVPLAVEPHLATWEAYAVAAKDADVFEVLKQRLVQLQFPIQAGISQTESYRAATRRGVVVQTTQRLTLEQPIALVIHPSFAGAIPVLIAATRSDFVVLVQALTRRNEPDPIPDSMGACIVSGFNNWDRIRQYRQRWSAQHPNATESDWDAEFQRLIPQKDQYQDRFILLSTGAYSGVSADLLGLAEAEWQRLSLMIRLEHECSHYFTWRLFNSMRNNVLDELIADYSGIRAAIGRYRADWFLRFMGLESALYREGGRLQNYRGCPPLSDGAFLILQRLVRAAAAHLEQFDQRRADAADRVQDAPERARIVSALTCLTLEELASPEAINCLQQTVAQLDTAAVLSGAAPNTPLYCIGT